MQKVFQDYEKGKKYGALDMCNTLMYIPETLEFSAMTRAIDPCKGQVGMKDSAPRQVNHPGGPIFALRGGTNKEFVCYPITFIAPSFVTISKEDFKEMRIDIETPRSHNSANWPGMSQIEDCPKCRKKTVIDGKTEHIMCLQPASMMSYPERNSARAGKLLWRVFCVPCFERISGSLSVQVIEDGVVVQKDVPSIMLIREGYGAPFDPTGKLTVPAYTRSSTMTYTGGRMKVNKNVAEGDSQKMTTKFKMKTFEKCAHCNKSPTELAMEDGELSGKTRLKAFHGCSACKKVRYCSKECQTFHWKAGHKLVCKQLALEK